MALAFVTGTAEQHLADTLHKASGALVFAPLPGGERRIGGLHPPGEAGTGATREWCVWHRVVGTMLGLVQAAVPGMLASPEDH